jgi:shikimate kinase
MKHNVFYLTGFMGSGKSTVGPILANTLGWNFYDLDREIESFTGMKIRELFDKNGEAYLREIESQVLADISQNSNVIISLGGGTITIEKNLQLMKSIGKIIFLKVSPKETVQRLKYKRDRPVLLSGLSENFSDEELLSKISALYEARKHYYEQSDYVIDTDNLQVGKTVDIIYKLIKIEAV